MSVDEKLKPHNVIKIHTFSYDGNGKLLSKIEKLPPKPIKLKWDLSDEQLMMKIDEAYRDGLKLENVSYLIFSSTK